MRIALVLILFSSFCHGWYEVVSNYEGWDESSLTVLDATWTRSSSYYWMAGQYSKHNNHNEDRQFKMRYKRPNDANTNYADATSWHTYDATHEDRDASELSNVVAWWRETCSGDSAIDYIQSSHDDDSEDREFDIKCKKFPRQFTLGSCAWTGWINEWDEVVDYTCNGVLNGIDSRHSNKKEDRRFEFLCCDIINHPMDISQDYSNDRVVTQITSVYNADGTRSTYTSTYGKPNWYYDANTISSQYSLTKTRFGVYWTRVCPRNGAFASITQNEDGTFSFECAQLINEVKMGDCYWTDYINEFHADFSGNCDIDGGIRGIDSYYSHSSDDERFKIYCCVFKRETYTPNTNIIIRGKTAYQDEYDKSYGVLLFDLCWNNMLYQGILIMNEVNTWFNTDDVVHYGSCGNERTITVSTDSTDRVRMSDVAVKDNGIDYIINSFDVYESDTVTLQEDFALDKDDIFITDVIIKYPDDYLTTCVGEGCTGSLYYLDNYQQYLITITPCASFTVSGGDTPQIGVVLRGTNHNLDKEILTGPIFDEMPSGTGNIGDLISIDVEYEAGPDFCIQELILNSPYHGITAFGKDYFGDGIILSPDCEEDGDFRLLSGIQYVRCYDKPFRITTYETSLYTSVQVHACSGSDAGLPSVNTAMLSLTITGISKSDTFLSSDPLSLKSKTDWAEDTSRDYTLQLSGDYEKIALITLTNNDPNALCVDSVLINGQDAFLSDYWVGATIAHNSIRTIPAVLEWPICDVQLKTTIETESPLPVDPQSVATSVCVNRNRLVSVECEISQTFETYEEVSWAQETGQEVSHDVTMEAGTSTVVSVSSTEEVGYEVSGKGVSFSEGVSESSGLDREWSSSMSTSQGVTTMDVTTDGKVNGETISISCSGSVTVPPSQQISYAMLIEHSAATLTTLTDITMTKCSAYLYGKDTPDASDYIYIYGRKGTLTVKDATNCYVSFSQAEQVSPEAITCGQERALATREWATYVPQCDTTDPTKYMKCQCAFGDTLTAATCGCVDETTGNLPDTEKASVVYETDTFKWTDWCLMNCGLRSLGTDHNGMKAIYIPLIDSLPGTAFNASSQWRSYTPASSARLSWNGWMASESDTEPYLLIDLGEEHTIVSMSVWPRHTSSSQYVKTYSLLYSVDGTTFIEYASILNGPQHGYTGDNENDKAYSFLYPEIKARYLKFIPLTWVSKIAMRVEAYTLRYNETSQSVPETVDNRNIDVYFDKKKNFFEENPYIFASISAFGVFGAFVVYFVNSCISWKQYQDLHKYQSVDQYDESKNM